MPASSASPATRTGISACAPMPAGIPRAPMSGWPQRRRRTDPGGQPGTNGLRNDQPRRWTRRRQARPATCRCAMPRAPMCWKTDGEARWICRRPRDMPIIENRTFDEIAIGDGASTTHTLTREDIELFAIVSHDVNPAQLDPAYAETGLLHSIFRPSMWGGVGAAPLAFDNA